MSRRHRVPPTSHIDQTPTVALLIAPFYSDTRLFGRPTRVNMMGGSGSIPAKEKIVVSIRKTRPLARVWGRAGAGLYIATQQKPENTFHRGREYLHLHCPFPRFPRDKTSSLSRIIRALCSLRGGNSAWTDASTNMHCANHI